MSSLLPAVTYGALVPGASSIDQKTYVLCLQMTIGVGVYLQGGIPAGLAAFANSLTINPNEFIQALFESELVRAVSSKYYQYKYIPSTDSFQIFEYITDSNGGVSSSSELHPSEPIPSGVLNDIIVGTVRYSRLPGLN